MSKTKEAVVVDVMQLRKDLAEAKRAHKMGELKNVRQLRKLRREIARQLTAKQAPAVNKEEEK